MRCHTHRSFPLTIPSYRRVWRKLTLKQSLEDSNLWRPSSRWIHHIYGIEPYSPLPARLLQCKSRRCRGTGDRFYSGFNLSRLSSPGYQSHGFFLPEAFGVSFLGASFLGAGLVSSSVSSSTGSAFGGVFFCGAGALAAFSDIKKALILFLSE